MISTFRDFFLCLIYAISVWKIGRETKIKWRFRKIENDLSKMSCEIFNIFSIDWNINFTSAVSILLLIKFYNNQWMKSIYLNGQTDLLIKALKCWQLAIPFFSIFSQIFWNLIFWLNNCIWFDFIPYSRRKIIIIIVYRTNMQLVMMITIMIIQRSYYKI